MPSRRCSTVVRMADGSVRVGCARDLQTEPSPPSVPRFPSACCVCVCDLFGMLEGLTVPSFIVQFICFIFLS